VVWTNCRGIRTFPNGDQYVGEWRDGKPNGQGTHTNPNGDKNVGEFRDGKLSERGRFTRPNGDKYVGEFRDGTPNGQGTATNRNGDQYVGEWRDGELNGQGTATYHNGDNREKYVGEFRVGQHDGQGTLTFRNGDKYVGEFADGKYNGQGTYTFHDGQTKSGIWKDSKLVKENSGIPVEIEAGTFIVPVTINGKITLNFIIDSGASDVAVPADVVSTLIRTGSIKEEDFLGEKQYELADGSTVPSATFVLRSLKVGDKVVKNVRASVASAKGSLLLGQSFLNRFNSWSVDNRQRLLFLN
jgi:clan AA aspartic protease (TIGR02281 family)